MVRTGKNSTLRNAFPFPRSLLRYSPRLDGLSPLRHIRLSPVNAPISEIKNANTRFFRRVAFYWLIFASGAFCECYVMGWIRPYDTTLESVIKPACLLGYSLALDWLQLPIAFVRHVL